MEHRHEAGANPRNCVRLDYVGPYWPRYKRRCLRTVVGQRALPTNRCQIRGGSLNHTDIPQVFWLTFWMAQRSTFRTLMQGSSKVMLGSTRTTMAMSDKIEGSYYRALWVWTSGSIWLNKWQCDDTEFCGGILMSLVKIGL
jgi:hypothetical protein